MVNIVLLNFRMFADKLVPQYTIYRGEGDVGNRDYMGFGFLTVKSTGVLYVIYHHHIIHNVCAT